VASAHLGPLEPDEVRPYLEHRLRRVGWAGRPAFEPAIFGEIWAYSRGLPRRINLLAARLLVQGAIERRSTLTADDARELARELERENILSDEAAALGAPADAAAAATFDGGRPEEQQQRSDEALRREVERLQRRLETVQDDLGRERGRLDGARAEADRLRDDLRRLEIERLRIDSETTRRLAELLGEAHGHRRGFLRHLF
jgi:chromosome segregation ATPase